MSKTEVVPWHGMREAPIVLVTGPESYLADRVFRELRDRVRIAQPELEVTDLDGATYAVGTLLDVASPSLFGEPRMIRIANGESGGDDFVADFQSYLDVIADVAETGARNCSTRYAPTPQRSRSNAPSSPERLIVFNLRPRNSTALA